MHESQTWMRKSCCKPRCVHVLESSEPSNSLNCQRISKILQVSPKNTLFFSKSDKLNVVWEPATSHVPIPLIEKVYLCLQLHRNSASESRFEPVFWNSAQSVRTQWPPGKPLYLTIFPIPLLKREVISYKLPCYNLLVNSLPYMEEKKKLIRITYFCWLEGICGKDTSDSSVLKNWSSTATCRPDSTGQVLLYLIQISKTAQEVVILFCVSWFLLAHSFTDIKCPCHIHLQFSPTEGRKVKQT